MGPLHKPMTMQKSPEFISSASQVFAWVLWGWMGFLLLYQQI
jgi:hypothetical protein